MKAPRGLGGLLEIVGLQGRHTFEEVDGESSKFWELHATQKLRRRTKCEQTEKEQIGI